MKKIVFIFVMVMGFSPLISMSQIPELLNYQAIVRNSEGELVKNQNLSARISIVDDLIGTNVIYQEIHQTATNAYGSINLKIGAGTENVGAFNSIDWESSERYIQMEIDLGEGYVNLGSVQLVSVPYALCAKQVLDKNDADSDSTNEIQDLFIDNNILTITKNQNPTEISLAAYQGENTDNQELTLSETTLSISGGNDIDLSSLVNDSDTSITNELQLLSVSNDTIYLEEGGFVKLPIDQVNDGDTSQTNEIQNLTFSGDTLTLGSANEVVLPYDSSRWTDSGNNLYFNRGNVGIGVKSPNGKLEVQADTSFSETDTLFAVKDRNGNIVFAVFNDGVKVYVNEGAKGNVGGFAISGRGTGKASTEYSVLNVTPDSARFYLNEGTKGTPGGFAVSGRGTGKSVISDYLQITPDSTRIYINENATKGTPGGFAVSGRGYGKGLTTNYFTINSDSTRIFINDTTNSKSKVGGFAITGGNQTNGTVEPIFVTNLDSTRIFTKDSLGGFSVRDTKNGGNSSYMQLTPENYFIGHESGIHTTGTYNNFFGYQSGYTNTTGSNNVFMGYQSGYGMDVGENNILLGYQAGKLSTEGNNNAIIGAYAGYENNGDYNVFIGFESGYSNVSGADSRYSNYNTFIGYQTGKSNTTGWHNLCIGYQAGMNNQTATNQFFIGDNSGENLTDGYGNTYVGHLTGTSSINCSENTILGYQAGNFNQTGNNNVYIGYASGIKALGSNNVFIGRKAGGTNEQGSGNVFIGAAAGYSYLGSNKLFIDNSSTANPLIWGDFDNNRLVINGDSSENGSNYTFYVNGAAGGSTPWNNLSDGRLKSNIYTISGALQKIMMLKGIYYSWKNNQSESDRQIGFVAQDVEKVLPEVVNSDGKYYSMQYAPITAVLVEAVKEQQNLITNQTNEIQNLKDENEKLKSDLENIIKRLEQLEK